MKRKFKCILLINDRLSNFINKITIDEAGFADRVIRLHSAQQALNYLEDSIQTSETSPFPELIFLGIDNTGFDAGAFLGRFNELNKSFPVEPIMIILTQSTNVTDVLNLEEVSEVYPNVLTDAMLQSIVVKYFPPMQDQISA